MPDTKTNAERAEPAPPQKVSEAQITTLGLEQLQTPIWIYDTQKFCIHWANTKGLELWQAESLQELSTRNFRPEMSDAIYTTLSAYLDDFSAGHTINRWWQLSPKGHSKNVFCRFSGIRLNDGRMAMLCEGLEEDILEYDLLSSNTTMVSMFDSRHGALVSANPAFANCYGTGIKTFQDLFDDPRTAGGLLQQLATSDQLQMDIEVQTPQGQRWHYMELRLTPGSLRPGNLLVMQLDISSRKQSELDQRKLADTDALTGLLNRHALLRQLAALAEDSQPFALLYMDLDGFKLINDTFGHSVGDALLELVAQRIRDHGNDHCCLARIGGDEFILAAPVGHMQGDPVAFAARLIDLISRPYQVAGFGNLNIGASVGIALYPRHARDMHDLIAKADTAMYAAKRRGRMRHAVFSPDIHNSVLRRTVVVQCLHKALEQGAFNLHYQPIYNLREGTLPVMEALLRWQDPELGPVGADEAIAAAEESGLIRDLDRWVWQCACTQLRKLQLAGHPDLCMAVNVSGTHVLQDDFIDALTAQVHQAQIEPRHLILELTETAMMMDIEGNIDLFHELKNLGFRLAIDDFGTGYSSLAYLHQLPAETLKIDRSFIARLAEDQHSIRFVRDLAHAQGKQIVAEGVEQDWQYRLLTKLGIHFMQGYLFARPMPAGDLQRLLDARIYASPGSDC